MMRLSNSLHRLRTKGPHGAFTLIEVLVFAAILVVLLRASLTHTHEQTDEDRRQSCLSNLAGVDKAVAIWEAQNTALSTSSPVSLTFNGQGDLTAVSGTVPGELNSAEPTDSRRQNNKRVIASFVRYDNMFLCPEYANRNGGFTKAPRSADIYKWFGGAGPLPGVANRRCGACCLTYGSPDGKAFLTGPDGTADTAHRPAE